MTPRPQIDPSSMLQVAGGFSAIAIALAIWADDRSIGADLGNGKFLTLAFLWIGLVALLVGFAALTLLWMDRQVNTNPNETTRDFVISFLFISVWFALMSLAVAHFALLVILLT